MAKQIRLNKSETRKVSKFLQLLKQQGFSISRAILFGSYAKGKANPDSDIDIAVVSNQFGQDITEEMMMLRKIALKVDSHLEPVPLCPEDLDDNFSTLAQEIKRYGIDVSITRATM
ncbi:MAG: nucleotidyltransferase domain-containing protein [Sedimentisphaerales bacterium]